MTRCLACLAAGALLGVITVTLTGLALIEFTDAIERDFRHV